MHVSLPVCPAQYQLTYAFWVSGKNQKRQEWTFGLGSFIWHWKCAQDAVADVILLLPIVGQKF